MKRIIIDFEEKPEKFKEIIQESLNLDFLNFLVSKNTFKDLRVNKRLNFYSKDQNLKIKNFIYKDYDDLSKSSLQKDRNYNYGIYFTLKSKDDEEKIIEITKHSIVDFVIIKTTDWKIIPFENLISYFQKLDAELIAHVSNINEAELLLKTLEIGVDGILFKPKKVGEIGKIKKLLSSKWKIRLDPAEILDIQSIPEADRVCVDTTSLLHKGEGMLVGSTAKGFVLVHAEVFETDFISSRPFRVNAGDVSSYIIVPNGETTFSNRYRTKYLSELKGGDKVLIFNKHGEGRIVSVGRVKIETRPMLRFDL
ncbi:MAG: 3-dehydroquinate synthase II, partial [Candidatus Lokiarchaeota archaeon]